MVCFFRWKLYTGDEAEDFIAHESLREPVRRRFISSAVFKTVDWPSKGHPRYLQETDTVQIRRPDGSLGDILTVVENDPFNGTFKVLYYFY